MNGHQYENLTGLPTMFYFFDLAEEWRKKQLAIGEDPVALFIDLNGMKNYNSKYGFAEGDKLIRSMANVLKDFFGDDNCSRFGGDHFAVLTKSRGLRELLQEFIEECNGMNGGQNLPLNIGVYSNTIESVDAATAFDRAKMACDTDHSTYTSHITYFNESMLESMRLRHYIIDNFDRAMEEEWIEVHYQPIIRAANDKVCDVESLARWRDPVMGMISPVDFVPVLEDARLIHRLDLYMLGKTLEKLENQLKQGIYIVPSSVNLSRVDFEVCDIVEEVRKLVDESKIGRDMIVIEITESVLAKNFEYMKTQIERFRELGFRVWMDDYGSGYSSPDILHQIQFDTIKFDIQFMRNFDSGEKSRIILTELIKMSVALGIDTVVEGVETKEQVDFLTEIGCTKMQGFFYSQALSVREIIERHEAGEDMGFENPDEKEYFDAIGRLNLYDLSFATDDPDSLGSYFETIPMVVYEYDGEKITIARTNSSHRKFVKEYYPNLIRTEGDSKGRIDPAPEFVNAMKQCDADGGNVVVEQRLEDGTTFHVLTRKIAVNPVTGVSAYVSVALSIEKADPLGAGLSYAHIAQALSADYINLYYVDLETNEYVEYSNEDGEGSIDVERRGKDFFKACREDALTRVYEDDREEVIRSLTKENVIDAILDHDSFTMTYRIMMYGEPVYVSMKAVPIQVNGFHIIIGVNNVDAEMKHQEILNRVKEERVIYSRVMALSGDYVCIYTVNPETEEFVQYNSTLDYERLGFSKTGDNFFKESHERGKKVIHPDDYEYFLADFDRENVYAQIKRRGFYVIRYRMKINGEYQYMRLKAVEVDEPDGKMLIVGANNVDAQVKREQQYERNLSVARNRANIDGLTGVKNKHAYLDAESKLDNMILNKTVRRFAVAVFDLNNLKEVNDVEGHQEGDECIKEGCNMICRVFKHSPVFRIGGDEFAVIVQGDDYDDADGLMSDFHDINRENLRNGNKVIMAGGMSKYKNDESVAEVFSRADEMMYENKMKLKRVGL